MIVDGQCGIFGAATFGAFPGGGACAAEDVFAGNGGKRDMTDENKRRLMEAGIDVDDALARLMQNEGLFLRLLRAFLQDGNLPGCRKPLPKEMFRRFYGGAHAQGRGGQSFDEGSVCAGERSCGVLAGRRSRRCRGKDACRGGGVSQGGGRAQCGRIRLGFVLAEKMGGYFGGFLKFCRKNFADSAIFTDGFKEFNR